MHVQVARFLRRCKPTDYARLAAVSILIVVLLWGSAFFLEMNGTRDVIIRTPVKQESRADRCTPPPPRADRDVTALSRFLRVTSFAFLPKEFRCDDLFARQRVSFSYADDYWQRIDSYKGALSLAGVLRRARINEQSWVIHEIAKSELMERACETGFDAGHNAFMALTANQRLELVSFNARARNNYSVSIAEYMSNEFYSQFNFFKDVNDSGLRTLESPMPWKCDLILIGNVRQRSDVRSALGSFRKMANYAGNVIVMDVHADATNSAEAREWKAWDESKRQGVIVEHFRCRWNVLDSLSMRTDDHIGFVVGSFIENS